ncbi:DUF2194 domain-containing protein [Fodinibius sediminis]|uniref:DUF2194 domain-containing protein n=1 Tax=Fodinibius sediminis TaxID=1214077 RepID=A0A521DD33_9BACT|nr:DUF2194 domain-containing protein [Fodinibius sediminis]SMO69492.1 hypothetical protein SAMN06265218_109196 [Fodinibius sediminis]
MSNMLRSFFIISFLVSIFYGWLGGCSTQRTSEHIEHPLPVRAPLVFVIGDHKDSTSITIDQQLSKTLDYAGIPYTNHDLSVEGGGLSIPITARLVYLTTDRVEQLSDESVERLVQFVAKGNQLLILRPLFDDRFAYLLGLKRNSSYAIDRQAEGYFFQEPVLPDVQGKLFQSRQISLHNGFQSSEFSDKVGLIATAASDTTYPVIVERSIGEGKSVYFNTSQMTEKNNRGLLFSSGVRALEGIPYEIANVSTIFLDDFPAPLYDRKLPPIDKEYDITHAEFVQRIWWPEMKALADSFGIDYTAMLTFNYNATVVPPFNFNEWEASKITINGMTQNTSPWLANDILDSRHELGFHGYNHFSLWLKDWQNRGYMEAALGAAKKRWRINSPGTLPESYAPPTNEIDSVGLTSLRAKFPEIKYMSSLYNGQVEEGGGREFGPDPFVPSLFDYPRITSGYINNNMSSFNQHSLFLYTGIWTHFIHPDDVFQVMQRAEDDYRSRNPEGLGWHSSETHDYGLYEVFQQRLENTVNEYPFIRFVSVSEAGPIVQNWLNTQNRYDFSDSTLKVNTAAIQRGTQDDNQQFWFTYVSDSNRIPFEQSLLDSEINFTSSTFWDGKLYQFSTTSDSLTLPLLIESSVSESTDRREVMQAVRQYRDYTSAGGDSDWVDTRFEEAVAALEQNPSSRNLQDKVIELAVEFDSINTAIDVLEQQLMKQPIWNAHDVQKLLKFYGWEGQSGRAFSLLEELWVKYPGQSIISLKKMMIEEYGIPDDEFQKKWTQRALALEPKNESLLREMVRLHYSVEEWSKRKQYIKRLIDLNPRSDTLYHFALDNSMAYESPQKTLEWLRDFPAEATQQLQPLASDIAYMYANEGALSRAVVWGQRTEKIPAVMELDWLLQQKRYHDFLNRSKTFLKEQPQNDSLRTFIGQQLIYENFRKEGFRTLYPLFQRDQASPESKELLYSEIGYMNYEQKKQFFQSYSDFFNDSLRSDLDHTHRKNEGFEVGTNSSFASDNFDNEIATVGLFSTWGKRPELTHSITLDEKIIASNILGNDNVNNLYHLSYRYQRSYKEQTRQSFMKGGVYLDEGAFRPDIETGFSFSKDSSFTSTRLQFEPVFTNRGVRKNMNQVTAMIYREDHWLKDQRVQTALSLTGSWYSNDVFEHETLARFYINLPFSTRFSKVRPVAHLSYSNASEHYRSGVPYYTPDHLFIKGGGIDYSYRDQLYDPDFSAGLTLMAKHDNRSGAFFSANARLSARIHRYWQLSLETELSTSSEYRYNNVGFNISYLLPKTFTD